MSPLFSPFRLGHLQLPNRIVLSPMCQYSAEPEGVAGEWHRVHLGQYASAGLGLVIVEATAIEPLGRITPHCLGLYNDKQRDALATIIGFHKRHHGPPIGIQIGHAGRKASTTTLWQGSKPLPPEQGGWQSIGPSALPYSKLQTPRGMDETDIERVINGFADAAKRADQAGFDLLELHGAHGYLLHQFLSPLSNQRTDQYGGSLENRMRFPLAVAAAVARVWPTSKPWGVRISATDWVEGGWDIEQSVVFSKALKALGCAFIDVSSGALDPRQKIPVGPGYQVPFSSRIRQDAEIPTITVGMINEPQQAEQIVAGRQADLVALGRSLLLNPHWAWQAAHALGLSPEQSASLYPHPYERAATLFPPA
ncbi:MAG: NADH:flavin oxidoreductase/NADH oxidase [Gammaproteobacteria bacterium]|nr:NADH:flavin oxidoreductase/NADH oxidase [Gammaproteobacteria bacterium]